MELRPTEKKPMKNRSLIVFLAACVLACPLQAQQNSSHAWQAGMLTDVEPNDEGAVTMPVSGMTVVVPIRKWTYTVETNEMVYVFGRRSLKPLNVIVNRKLKFALESNMKATVLDDQGKEFHVSVIRKIAKTPHG